MKVLIVTDNDFDVYNDWLTESAGKRFREGSYTHIFDGDFVYNMEDQGKDHLVLLCDHLESDIISFAVSALHGDLDHKEWLLSEAVKYYTGVSNE